jgi:hypothetical protein
MLIRIAACAALLFLSACTTVNHTPLTTEASQQLTGKSFVRTNYEKPDFAATTPSKMAFALVGAFAAISEGNQIIKDNEVPDPAIAISEGLIARLKDARSVSLVPSQKIASDNNVATLIKEYPGADFLIDTQTLGWMFIYYPSDWTHYRIIYNARLRVIDTKNGKVIGESMCKLMQGDDKNPPTYDQLLADKAELLKTYLSKAAKECVPVLAKDILLL